MKYKFQPQVIKNIIYKYEGEKICFSEITGWIAGVCVLFGTTIILQQNNTEQWVFQFSRNLWRSWGLFPGSYSGYEDHL